MAAYRTEKQRAELEDRKADEALKNRVLTLRGILGSIEAVALRLNMSAATLYRRVKEPGSMSLKEYRAMARLEKKLRGGDEKWLIA